MASTGASTVGPPESPAENRRRLKGHWTPWIWSEAVSGGSWVHNLTSWLCHLPSFKARVGWQSRGSGILRGAVDCTSDRGKGQHQTTNDEDMAIFTEHPNWDDEPVKPLSWGAESRRFLLQDVTESDSPGGFALVSRKFSFWKSISPFALYDVYLGYPGPFESLNRWMFSKHCPKGQCLSRKYLAGNYISNSSDEAYPTLRIILPLPPHHQLFHHLPPHHHQLFHHRPPHHHQLFHHRPPTYAF